MVQLRPTGGSSLPAHYIGGVGVAVQLHEMDAGAGLGVGGEQLGFADPLAAGTIFELDVPEQGAGAAVGWHG